MSGGWTREASLKGAAASHAVTSARKAARAARAVELAARGMPAKVIAGHLGVTHSCVLRYLKAAKRAG